MGDQAAVSSLPLLSLTWQEVFPSSPTIDDPYFSLSSWTHPILFFVGRNGSGKSRTARRIAQRVAGSRFLSTHRLLGLMQASNYGWAMVPAQESYRGVPLGDQERTQARSFAETTGIATDDLYTLREQPHIWLRVAAFLRRALGRIVDLRERAGFLDPYVRVGDVEYSLFREEGHGLREIVVLLTAAYRDDWKLLVVDEPELHLHPSMVRLWISELESECVRSGRRAILVSHEPTMLKPKTWRDLDAIWHFATGVKPSTIDSHVLEVQRDRVSASVEHNPRLVSQLVFSPRPVLVEGTHDVAALTVTLGRTQPPEVVAQTELIECGGSGGVALWFEIARRVGLDVRAVADLDAAFSPEVQRTMDASHEVQRRYCDELATEPQRTKNVLRPLLHRMSEAGVPNDPKQRAAWLAALTSTDRGDVVRRDKLLAIWRDAGLWLHKQGRLEDVLGLTAKDISQAQTASKTPGPIDDVGEWVAYTLDQMGEVEVLLNAAAERIAHEVMEALRLSPGAQFSAPVGPTSETDRRLVSLAYTGEGMHQLTVLMPVEFAGWSFKFSRDTASSELALQPPKNKS